MSEYIKKEDIEQKIQDGLNNLVLGHDAIEVLGMIYEMPSEDVATVLHGRWISWEKAGNFVPSSDRHECSVCHDAAQVLVNGFELLSDYCPNCGAKMME